MAALVIPKDGPVAMYLSFNNQAEGFMLPVLPPSLEVSNGGDDATYSTSAGEIQVIKHPKLTEYKFESLFPNYVYPFIAPLESAGEFAGYFPMDYVNFLEKWMRSGKPIRFVYVGTGFAVNEAVSIASFNWKEVAGTPGDIEYDLTLKRYVFYGAEPVKVTGKTSSSKAAATKTAGRTGKRAGQEIPSTYKLKAGDTLWSVAQRFKLTVAGLQKLNHISDAETRRLAVGREIRLH